jgi:hypothetical protein
MGAGPGWNGIVLGGFRPSGVLCDGTSIWVANSGDNGLIELDPSDGSPLGTVNVGLFPYALAFDGTKIWVTNQGDYTVTDVRVDKRESTGNRARRRLPVPYRFRWPEYLGCQLAQLTSPRFEVALMRSRFSNGISAFPHLSA